MPPVTPSVVDRLIGGDRVQPGTYLPIRIKLLALQMDLEKGLLKHVLGHFGVAQIMAQIAEQFLFVPVDQLFKELAVPFRAVAQQKLLVAPRLQRIWARAAQMP
jgi:hypothetical protein